MRVRGQNGCFAKHPFALFALFQPLQNKHFRKTYKTSNSSRLLQNRDYTKIPPARSSRKGILV